MKRYSPIRFRLSACAVAAVLTVLMIMSSGKSAAAQASDAAERCTPDVMRLCSEFVPDADRIVVCLKAKRRQLTPACRAAFQPQGKYKRRARRTNG